ncbi:F-box/RNI-like/FBD-like domains-containing protein [Rhynchospora pubera]|uniref:F-box/RNI-like/FBD-like domains-containing protein n=1 Tax=Rhynchospora pubera TaxID=906938 RepID=A0AAV8DF14_9POAL|nr:F-box/RNI-like/FBD-like domains-containing protein [Rhynchospora pubera]
MQDDYFSNIPDELIVSVLSFLNTHEAARTSLLARRFRHLWKSSLSINIFSTQIGKFVAMADRAILQRNPVEPLLNLRLFNAFIPNKSLPVSLISSCLIKACNLDLRHLIIHDSMLDLEPILPIIFSIHSLESLRLDSYKLSKEYSFPSATMLRCLKSLRFFVFQVSSAKFNRLLLELCCLEDLHLEMMIERVFSISSQTIRRLKLTRNPRTVYLELSTPSLELLHYESDRVPCIRGDTPSLRKVVFKFDDVTGKDVNAMVGLLKYISHAEELTLKIKEDKDEMYPFSILLEPGKIAATFSRLKHLDVTACFHKFNLQDVVTLLHHSPALESVMLVHKAAASCNNFGANKRKKKDWASKLPLNADGNRCYAYFLDLHLGKNSEEFMKLLNKKFTPKRQRMKPQSKKCTFLKNRGC